MRWALQKIAKDALGLIIFWLILGAWGLIDNDPNTGDPNQEDMDLIVILTKDSYYVAYYDDEVDKVMNYQRVALSDIEIIEFGVTPHSVSTIWISVHFSIHAQNQQKKTFGQKLSKKISETGMACIGFNRGHTFCSAKIFKISKPPETKSNFRYLYLPEQIYFVNLALVDSVLWFYIGKVIDFWHNWFFWSH